MITWRRHVTIARGGYNPHVKVLPHLRHRWVTIEQIGKVVVQECGVCGKTRVRVR
ncbi:hypothetical protein GCM10022248_43660 [Nonomuraea soli]